MGESQEHGFPLSFNPFLRVGLQGSRITSKDGLLGPLGPFRRKTLRSEGPGEAHGCILYGAGRPRRKFLVIYYSETRTSSQRGKTEEELQ